MTKKLEQSKSSIEAKPNYMLEGLYSDNGSLTDLAKKIFRNKNAANTFLEVTTDKKIRYLNFSRKGACRTADPDLFFDSENAEEVRQAYCDHCPVARMCMHHAVEFEESGIWAGVTEQERRPYRQAFVFMKKDGASDEFLEQFVDAAWIKITSDRELKT